MADPFLILGVSANAGSDEIRRRYLELVRQHPPDRDPARFAEIRAAYDELRDPVQQLHNLLFDVEPVDTIDHVIVEREITWRRCRSANAASTSGR